MVDPPDSTTENAEDQSDDELDLGWPVPPEGVSYEDELLKKIEESKIALRQKQGEYDGEIRVEAIKATQAQEASLYDSILEVSKTAGDRARTSAELVEKSATALGAAYVAVLGLAFSVGDNPLPTRGVYSAVFLGLAVILATAFVAYMTKPKSVPFPGPSRSPQEAALNRVGFFIRWTQTEPLKKRFLLQASVVALGLSLAFLPAPFITATGEKDQGGTVTVTEWPVPEGSGSPVLDRFIYKAQVAEVAEARKDELKAQATGAPKDGREDLWFKGFLAGLALVGVTLAIGFIRSRKN